MLPRVLRSRRAEGMEEEEVVEIGGCAARADLRVGEGIARPRLVCPSAQQVVWSGEKWLWR